MPRPGRMTTERAKDFKGTLRQLLAAMSKYKLSLVVVIVFAVLSTIFNIAGPKILAKATTALATGWMGLFGNSSACTESGTVRAPACCLACFNASLDSAGSGC